MSNIVSVGANLSYASNSWAINRQINRQINFKIILTTFINVEFCYEMSLGNLFNFTKHCQVNNFTYLFLVGRRIHLQSGDTVSTLMRLVFPATWLFVLRIVQHNNREAAKGVYQRLFNFSDKIQ